MCLNTISNRIKNTKYGWKVFSENTFINTLHPVYRGYKFKINKWNKSSNTPIISNYGKFYESGFHFFYRRKDAVEFCKSILLFRGFGIPVVKKIKVKEVVATGYQDELKVGVCKKIFIEED